MTNVNIDYEQQLCDLIQASKPCMAALQTVRSLGLSSWCIGAGFIRSLVWDFLHDFSTSVPAIDVDVVYFDAGASTSFDTQLQERLSDLLPDVAWDVTNQATVHEWLVDDFGVAVAPLTSLEDGMATWPEFATCVGVYLGWDDTINVIAPYGLDDLFQLRVRHNPRRASANTFIDRVQSKQFAQRWPRLSIIAP